MNAEHDVEWRPIPGYPDYFAGSNGRIVSTRRSKPHVMTQNPIPIGYIYHWLTNDAEPRRYFSAHQIVALAFLGPRPAGMEIRHLDGNRTNNAVSNLAYGTPSENQQDVIRHGRHKNLNKTHCPRNHAYDETNTMRTPDGRRRCRTCVTAQRRERRINKSFQSAGIGLRRTS